MKAALVALVLLGLISCSRKEYSPPAGGEKIECVKVGRLDSGRTRLVGKVARPVMLEVFDCDGAYVVRESDD